VSGRSGQRVSVRWNGQWPEGIEDRNGAESGFRIEGEDPGPRTFPVPDGIRARALAYHTSHWTHASHTRARTARRLTSDQRLTAWKHCKHGSRVRLQALVCHTPGGGLRSHPLGWEATPAQREKVPGAAISTPGTFCEIAKLAPRNSTCKTLVIRQKDDSRRCVEPGRRRAAIWRVH
jgi:hypothetical protein